MNFVAVASYNDYVSAHIAKGRLEEDGISSWLKDENTVTINPVWTQAVGGIKLMVNEKQAEAAINILKQITEQHKKSIACPRCGSHDIEKITTPRKPANWLSAIMGFLFVSYALPVDYANHCFNCGHEFDA
jgi:predicted RNA-binding Zn-ribbon protein involved in translation (DUF1610 family)